MAATTKKTGRRSATARSKTSVKKTTGTRKRKTASRTKTISAEERYRMIQEAAYLRAEKAGFAGDPVQFWLEAEREIDSRLAASGIKVKT